MVIINASPEFTMLISRTARDNCLSQISPTDQRFDNFRADADCISKLYAGTFYHAYASRIANCSPSLEFITGLNLETGEQKLKLKSARFCRCPRCPVCQWRKSLMWRAKVFKIIPKVFEAYPSARFIFLTLTVKTCSLQELRSTLAHMNKSWERLSKRKAFPGIGWIKTVEVTRCWDDQAHPHFHCLLMVNPSYFGGNYYLSQEKWTELWRKSLRVDYPPIVHIRAVRSLTGENQGMRESVIETLKYCVKPTDILGDCKPSNRVSDQEWLVGLTTELYQTRSISTGGILKGYLQHLESDDNSDDLIHASELGDSELVNNSASLLFDWVEHRKRYIESLIK